MIILGDKVITYPVILSASVASTQPTCNGTNNGSITISSPAGGSNTFQYSIDGGATWTAGLSNTNLAPGTYDVRIRDAAHTACVIILGDKVITYPVILSASVASTQPTCNGTNDGSITISSPAGGSNTFQYSIDGGATWTAGLSNTNLAPGTYDVRIRDAAHTACVIILGDKVITYPVILSASVASTQPTCNGTNDGSITISSPAGGSNTFQYSIDGGATWTAGLSNTNLAPGTYDVRIRDAAHTACVIILGDKVITYPVILSASVASTQPTCNGTNDGSITISSPAGGSNTFQYSIDGGATWTAGLSNTNLAPGTYDVRIRDAAHTACVIILGDKVITYPVILSASVASTQPTCNGTNDGSITISSPAGGSNTFQFSIDGGATWTAGLSNTNLAPGTYDVRIRDAAHTACVIILGDKVITYPVILSASVASTQPTCNGTNDGSITISSPAGGSNTFQYSIDGGATWTAGLSNTNLAPGTYDVRIRDAAHTACVIILGDKVITYPVILSASVASTDVTCFGAKDGAITISNIAGGYGTYEYSINGGTSWEASGNYTGLANGTYNVQIRDKGKPSCVNTLNGTLLIETPSAALTATLASTDVTCFGAKDGTITISNIAGGYGTYEYSINGGTSWEASGNYTSLANGTYNVQIRDKGKPSCVNTLNGTLLIETPSAALTATLASTDVTCFGAKDGTITISNIAGGYGTYEYSINGGTSWEASGNYTGLANGTYNVQIRDKGKPSCVNTLNGTLIIETPSAALTATLASTDVTCFGAKDGTITISNIAGGYGTYEYSINGGTSWEASGNYTSLANGTYNVQIRDKGKPSCVNTLNGTLIIETPSAALTATLASTDVTCFGAKDGTITISNIAGGYGTYEYSINGGTSWEASGNYTSLANGTYNVQIRDKGKPSCVNTLNGTLIIETPSAALTATLASTDVTCFGAKDGTITISNIAGGYGTYEYSINGGTSWEASGNYTGLANGTHNVQIRDKGKPSCVNTLNGTLIIETPSAALTATLASTDVTCFGAKDGTITISNIAGGYGTYEYSINGGTSWEASGNYTGLANGTYNVQIRDKGKPSCVNTLNGTLLIETPSAALTATLAFTDVTCFGAKDGTITISNIAGGYGTYEYSINGGTSWEASGNYTGLANGTYNVQIRDKGKPSCVHTLNGTLLIETPSAALTATLASTDVTCFGAKDGTITISNIAGGYGTYEYSINGGTSWEASGNYTGLANGTYNVQIRDKGKPSCVNTLNGTLLIETPSAALTATLASTDVTCFGAKDGTITISNIAGGYGTYEYSINGGTSWEASGNYTGLANGTYNVQIRDKGKPSCVNTLNGTLFIETPSAALTATLASTDVTCFGAKDGTITISNIAGGYGTYEYSINGGTSWEASGNYTGLANGTYNVQIRDKGKPSCVNTLNGTLLIETPSAALTATLASTDVTCFGAKDGTITISNIAGGYGTYEYSINGGTSWEASGNYTGLANGTYNVQIRDKGKPSCVNTLNGTLFIETPSAALTATLASTDVTCFGAKDGTITISNIAGGYGTYEYSINGGTSWEASGNYTGLANGTYNVQIRDKGKPSCVNTLNGTLIIETPSAALTATLASTDVTCFGAKDGTITISNIAGGYGTYEYSINGGTSWEASGNYTGLANGTYNVQIRDKGKPSCVNTLNGTLIIETPSAAVSATAIIINNNNCTGCSNGSIDLTVTGGTAPYTFLWSNAAITEDLSNLSKGSYSVEITDENGCIANYTYDIIESGIALVKTAVVGGNGGVGDIITYTFAVKNTGNVTITNIKITDITNPLIALTFSNNTIATLAPGETKSITGTYTITQADIDLGYVENSAFAVGQDPEENDVKDVSGTTVHNDDDTVTTLIQNPGLTVIKTSNTPFYSSVGDIINYTITVTNTGNVTLYNITVTDPLTGLHEFIGSLAPGSPPQTYTTFHIVNQNDREKGEFINTAFADGFDPNGDPIGHSDDEIVYAAIVLGCGTVTVHNAFSPNGDGMNETFIIDNIDDILCYPENTVEIYNRWGVLVFETSGYDNVNKVFRGYSEGRTTISQSSGLPTGTYYYILNYTSITGTDQIQANKKDGYLYLTR
ncbi:gliding motility-associated C-terminal domain-containing protein [Flavobacterium sp. K5-23]|uniref:DUF7507 domain-containing protein n=1 Tax=Flavobacterium sp. K5-23 TaxID=2746225 RepID=UPI00200E4FCE|nr:gliding motility-associated C-terminal domain-containing protein [Flavobacterium sp. K5-23]UQD57119.1 gliding motility-associated C-terminal domain-containing protein [Flavobacterium sp. K5-23]